jgi:hypothetical protein
MNFVQHCYACWNSFHVNVVYHNINKIKCKLASEHISLIACTTNRCKNQYVSTRQLRSFLRKKSFLSKNLPVPDKDVRMAHTSLRKSSVFQFILFWFKHNVHPFSLEPTHMNAVFIFCEIHSWQKFLDGLWFQKHLLLGRKWGNKWLLKLWKVYEIYLIMGCMKYLRICMYW